MEIKWFGENSFLVDEKKVKVSIDPQDESVKADIIIKTEQSGIKDDKAFVVDWPGEYEAKDVIIHAAPIGVGEGETRIISFEVDGISMCAMPQLEESPDTSLISELGDIDVLFVPMTIKPKVALDAVEEFDPRLAILSMTDSDGSNLAGFLKEVGQANLQPEESIEIKGKASLDSENTVYKYFG